MESMDTSAPAPEPFALMISKITSEASFQAIWTLNRTPQEQLSIELEKRPTASALLNDIQTFGDTKLFHEFTKACETYLFPEISGWGQDVFQGTERVEFIIFIMLPIFGYLDKFSVLHMIGKILYQDIPSSDGIAVLQKFDPQSFDSAVNQQRYSTTFMASETLAESKQGVCFNVTRLSPDAELGLLYKAIQGMLLSKCGYDEEAQDLLTTVQTEIQKATGCKTLLKSTLAAAFAFLEKARKNASAEYRHILFHLAYTPAGSMSAKERYYWASSACTCALISPETFNFGEVLHQPVVIDAILSCPDHEKSPRNWLKGVLSAFHTGDVARFEEYMQNADAYLEEYKLGPHVMALKRKMAIVALLRLAFTTMSSNSSDLSALMKSLSFSQIATTCRVTLDDVEPLVMMAFSKDLIRGEIDETTQLVHIKWVKPVLLIDQQSLSTIYDKLCKWSTVVSNVYENLKVDTAEVLHA